MPKNEINSLAVRVAEELNRYTKLLLAFSWAAIAYALNQAQGIRINYEFSFFLIALISWCASSYFGVRHMQLHREHMIENAKALLKGDSAKEMLDRLDPLDNKMSGASAAQYWLVVAGVTSYVAWYIANVLRA